MSKLVPVEFFKKHYYWVPAQGNQPLMLLPLGAKAVEYWSCCGKPKTI